jgi:AMMECR1 domain-containing protein
VIIRRGHASATFLPQVWEQLSKKEDFLGHLCLKAGLPRDAWKTGPLEVSTYQVQYFEEGK